MAHRYAVQQLRGVGDKPAVAAPPQRLRTHHGRLRAAASQQCCQSARRTRRSPYSPRIRETTGGATRRSDSRHASYESRPGEAPTDTMPPQPPGSIATSLRARTADAGGSWERCGRRPTTRSTPRESSRQFVLGRGSVSERDQHVIRGQRRSAYTTAGGGSGNDGARQRRRRRRGLLFLRSVQLTTMT